MKEQKEENFGNIRTERSTVQDTRNKLDTVLRKVNYFKSTEDTKQRLKQRGK